MTRCHSESLHDSLSCVVQPSANGAALTGRLMEDTTARWMSVMVVLGQSGILVKCFSYEWSWYVGVMFAAIVNTIDPFVSTSQLHSLGTAKPLILIIEGESLFTDGAAFITFEAFKDLAINLGHINASHFAVKLLIKVLGSPLIGFLMSKIMTFGLSRIFNDGLVEITISLAMTYITFYLAQWLGMSGVIAVLIMGLLLETVNFSPEIEVFLLRFWEMLTYLANTLIFFIVGIVIARSFRHTTLSDFLHMFVLYASVLCIRFLTVALLSPLLSRCGYGYKSGWALVCIWGATKGAFCLSLTLMAYQEEGLDKLLIREKVILMLSSGMVMLTLVINATTMSLLFKLVGLCDISTPKRVAMHNAVTHMRRNAQITFNMLKVDRFLADANWEMVEQRVHISDPYKIPDNKQNIEEFGPSASRCPDCDGTAPLVPLERHLDEMMEEARVRILKALKMSYWKQYSSGMLNREAARTLINTAEIMTDHKGKFMAVEDIKKYWQLRGLFVALKKKLEDSLYNIKVVKMSSRNAIQKLCCRIVFSIPFEFFIYILILLNVLPIIMEFSASYSYMYKLELSLVNYVFISAYVAEAVLKALAIGRSYIMSHWNQFDLFVIVLAIVDIIIDQYFASLNMHMIKIVRVSKMIRLTRVLRLVKVIIPEMIKLVDHQIHKQLSFGYDMLKGYIVGEEDISRITDHISDDQTICKVHLGRTKEHSGEEQAACSKRNRQKIRTSAKDHGCEIPCWSAGLLQRDYPEIAISLKTRQAARAVLNSKRETIQTLMLGGLLDEVEASKLEKMIEIAMKKLTKFPPTIPVQTPKHLLQNVPWLHDNAAQIKFMEITGSSLGEESRVIEYRSCGTIMGELNCLTQQPLDFTVTCETATQTCFIDINSLFEAFDVFPEEPSLEYKIWLSLAIKIATSVFMDNINYQSWTHHRICSYLSKAYLMDVEVNRKVMLYDKSMEDVVVIYGSCKDIQDQRSYEAPALISRTTRQVTEPAPTHRQSSTETYSPFTPHISFSSSWFCDDKTWPHSFPL
ncbi:hypothetical protein NFI96_010474 [Prochilodus magdalenae]|nr:hypothetical protein NFI96_010474 [Prochilodus magdalenae]